MEKADEKNLKDLGVELNTDVDTNDRHVLLERLREDARNHMFEPASSSCEYISEH